MKNIAIIPARGGSKRIPHKNIKPFLGKPIIAYSIDNAINSGLFDVVMVSTDDEEIARIAVEYGANVPFMRSSDTANDYATTADVLKEVISNYEKQTRNFDNMCCIYATAPLISPSDIISAYELLMSSDFISVYPIVQFSYPILRALQLDENGFVSMKWKEYAKTRSQDLEPMYHDSGTFYWHKIEPWTANERKSGGIVMDESRVQDIDNDSDWQLAEMKYRLSFDVK